MKATQDEIDRYMAVLGETVGRITMAVDGLETADIHHSGPGENSWTINEILAHLRACTDATRFSPTSAAWPSMRKAIGSSLKLCARRYLSRAIWKIAPAGGFV